MLGQLNMFGKDKITVAVERLKMFEPKEGYYLAFSGGKDSVVIKELANMASVKYDAHYNHTSVDPPELIYFIKQYHKDVAIEYPRDKDGKRITMWNLIPKKKMPPTRLMRYCCEVLKEHGGDGRVVVTGVRKAESARRKSQRAGLEIATTDKIRMGADPDNPDNARLLNSCPIKGKHIVNPIIDWTDEDVWEFIKYREIPYCKLYDEGFKRIGCVGCPSSNASVGFERYPKIKKAYLTAFEKMLIERRRNGMKTEWKTAEDVFSWWIQERK